MATFVLIAGACHGAWCWDYVAPLLEAAGHQVVPVDLPGMGEDQTPLDRVDRDSWARYVADLIKELTGPVFLLGQSRAGITISDVAQLCPDSITCLIYLCAIAVPSRKDIATYLQAVMASERSLATPVPNEDGTSFRFAPEAVIPVFYHRASLARASRACALLTNEPFLGSLGVMNTTPSRFGRVPRVYVECTDDRAVPLAAQRQIQDDIGFDRVISLDADHSPFFSDPEQLATILADLASAPPTASSLYLKRGFVFDKGG